MSEPIWVRLSGFSIRRSSDEKIFDIDRPVRRAAAGRALHPSVSMFFLSYHKMPRDFEERRHKGLNPTEFANEPINEWKIKFGHPTESIMNYFKTPNCIPPEYITYLIHYEKKTTRSFEEARKWFLNNLATALVCRVRQCTDIVIPPDVNTWVPPCGNMQGCNPLCHALQARLGILEVCVKIAKYNGQGRIVNHLYAHIDSHMPLLCSLSHDPTELAGIKELSYQKHACGPGSFEYILDITEPDLVFAYTEDTIPDLSSLIPLAIAFNKTPTSNKRFAQVKIPNLTAYNVWIVLLLTNVMYKSLPHRCNNRDFYSLVSGACKKDSSFRELVLKIIIASLLGVYEKAKEKMPTHLRCILYRFFYTAVPAMELIGALNKDNNVTLLYMGKEFCREICERHPGILRALKNLYEWDIYNKYTTDINNLIRSRVWATFVKPVKSIETFSDVFQDIDPIIQRMHEEYRKSQKENNVNYDIYEILKVCVDLNYRRYSAEGEIIMAGQEHLAPNPNPEIPQEHLDLMKEIIETFPPDTHVTMDWLHAFGVPFDCIRMMKIAVFSKTPDLHRTLVNLPRDIYAIFYNFFVAYRECLDYREYPCDVHMYYSHMKALHDYHHIHEGMPIPKVAGTIQVCPNCGDLKCVSFSERPAKNKNSKGNGVIMLTGEGTTVCAKTRKAADWREVHRQTTQLEDPEAELVVTEHRPIYQSEDTRKRKIAKLIATQHMLSKCRSTPTKTLRVLGQIVMFRRSTFIACFKCIGWLKLENAIYVGDTIICQSCYNKSTVPDEEQFRCEVLSCTKRINTKADGVQVFVYDDMPEKPSDRKFRMMQLCSYHGNFQWIRTGDNNEYVHRTSAIHERIHNYTWNRNRK